MLTRRRRLLAGGVSMGAAAMGLAGPAGVRAQAAGSGSGASAGTPAPAARRQVFGTGPTRIALLLETQSEAFGRATQAVIAGVRAALTVDGDGFSAEVVPIGENDENLPRLVQELAARRFAAAIGPLTRDNVNMLSDLGGLPVPMLALNLPDVDRRVPYNLAFFSLAIESEGRQVAQLAYQEAASRIQGRKPLLAVMISDSSALARRGTYAFSQGWTILGGALVDPVEIDTGGQNDWRGVLASVRADTAFAVVTADALRMVRAALRVDIPMFGTSQMNAVQANLNIKGTDLDGVRLVDMPWQLQPDNAAVMAYPRDRNLRHLDFQRLYALGIDAYRVVNLWVRGQTAFELDGVTGRLRVDLSRDLRVDRTPLLAEFRNGQVVPIAAP